jgi:hypothetical protein
MMKFSSIFEAHLFSENMVRKICGLKIAWQKTYGKGTYDFFINPKTVPGKSPNWNSR